MEDLFNASNPVLVSAFLTAIGWVIKSTPFIENKWIPIILPLIGSLAYPFVDNMTFDGRHFVIGFCLGAAATGLNQAYRQFSNSNQQKETNASEKTN